MKISVAEPSQVAEARRGAARMADLSGLDSTRIAQVELVVTEMATNLVKHAQAGEILAIPLAPGGKGLRLLSLDGGPGIADLSACLRDGYSTGGTPGAGLGAIRRLADHFDIYSRPGEGTAVLAELRQTAKPSPGGIVTAGISLAREGELECGDAWACVEHERGTSLLVVDGLGHGPLAAIAAREAVSAFRARPGERPKALMEAIHASLRSTRGAAVAVAEIERATSLLRWCGVGNIGGAVLSAGSARRTVSYNGIVGHNIAMIREIEYPCPPAAVVFMHSDGLSGSWDMALYPGLAERHPGIVAGVLYHGHRRLRDDQTAVAAKVL